MNTVIPGNFKHFYFLIILLIFTQGGSLLAQQQPLIPKKLSLSDSIARSIISRKFKIDKSTFIHTTPDKKDPDWIKGIHCYQAMEEGWGAGDPPGPPTTFIVTKFNKIFLSMPDALASIHFVPKNNADALRAAILIVSTSSPSQARVILSKTDPIIGIPQDVLSQYSLAPSVTKDNGHFTIILYSYISRNTQNKFVRGHHSLWKHVIRFNGSRFNEKITVLWEKRD